MGKINNITQAAKKIKCASSTLTNYCIDGYIPGAFKQNNRWYISEEDVQQLALAKKNHIPMSTVFTNGSKSKTITFDKNMPLQKACQISGWSHSALLNYCLRGLIPGAFQMGKYWYIPKETVEQLKEMHDNDESLQIFVTNQEMERGNIDEIEDYIDVRTASRITGYTVDFIRTLCKYGSIKYKKQPNTGQYRLSKKDILQYKDQHIDPLSVLRDSACVELNSSTAIKDFNNQEPIYNIQPNDEEPPNIFSIPNYPLPQKWIKSFSRFEFIRLLRAKADAQTIAVYAAITRNGDLYKSFHPATQEAIANNLELDDKSVVKAIQFLINAGIIDRIEKGSSRGNASVYRVLPPDYPEEELRIYGIDEELKDTEQPEPEAPIETPELEPEPEPEPPTPQEPEPSVVSSATIQGHELRLESVDAFDLFTQAYDALKLICDMLGGCTDKDMTAVYTDFDDIRKSLVLHRPDIEAINDYTYTLIYFDNSPTPAAFPVRKQSGEEAVA